MPIDPVRSAAASPAAAAPAPRPSPSAPPAASKDRLELGAPAQPEKESSYEKLSHFAAAAKLALIMPNLAADRVVTGYAVGANKHIASDGDFTIDLAPVDQDKDTLMYRGKRRALMYEPDKERVYPPQGWQAYRAGILHIEITEAVRKDHPELTAPIEKIKELTAAGKTPLIKVHGQWTFDPFHTGHMEIHPAYGLEVLDPDAVPPAETPPSADSGLWADPKVRFHLNSLNDGYTLRTGATVGNGGGVSVGISKDLFSFGSTPGYTADKDGGIDGYKKAYRGTVAPEVTGILARDGNSQLRVGGALGVESGTWGYKWRLEALGGEAFAGNAAHQGPYVGARAGFNVDIGPLGSAMGVFVQVDKTIAKDGPVTGTLGFSFSY